MSLIDTTASTRLTVEDEIEAAYTLLERQRRIEINFAYIEREETRRDHEDQAEFHAFMETNDIPLPYVQEEVPLFKMAKPLRRPSHKARSMTRTGSRRHVVIKDHGTKARYAEIKVENAGRNSLKKGSHRAWRKYVRIEANCLNPRKVNLAYSELIGS